MWNRILRMSRRLGPGQMADSLQWLSFALILIFLAQVITALFPIALLQPEWMLRVSGTLRDVSSLPMMALGLIMLASTIDGKVLPCHQFLELFRRIATFAAIGFLLLIPLQIYGTVVSIGTQLQAGESQLSRLTSAAKLVQNSSNEKQLRAAIGSIPGAEELAARPLGADVQTIKIAILDRLRESTNRLQNELKDRYRIGLQQSIKPLIRDGIIALGYAIGFAGMGYNKIDQPTPLRRMLRARNPQLLKEQGGRTDSTVTMPRPRRVPSWLKPWLK